MGQQKRGSDLRKDWREMIDMEKTLWKSNSYRMCVCVCVFVFVFVFVCVCV